MAIIELVLLKLGKQAREAYLRFAKQMVESGKDMLEDAIRSRGQVPDLHNLHPKPSDLPN
ncbi:hypothetical protein HF325_004909 [Metschnikowia pulcherrima]|uniref:Uncharacterized protein n=1 Tax=Metschnikowia pulcherrima TaxID=27326 RepID=A0A8H7GQ82_9ASCO|nr:hypothetical protein HF325_004909 [Metschnikowia pulcherrima]